MPYGDAKKEVDTDTENRIYYDCRRFHDYSKNNYFIDSK